MRPPGRIRVEPRGRSAAPDLSIRESVMDPTSAPAEVVHDFSVLGLFLQADPIVKGVMILLVVGSVACWTVVFEKIVRLAAAKRQAKAFETLVRSGGSLETDRKGIASHVGNAALDA